MPNSQDDPTLTLKNRVATPESFRSLVFDLDDTLIDTYKLLIPPTVAKTAEAFIKLTQTKKETLIYYLQQWSELHKKYSGRPLFEKIVTQCFEHFKDCIPVKNLSLKNISDALFEIYLKPELPETFVLEPAIASLLKNLKNSYHLYLVTQGNPQSQQAKINKLDLAQYFKMLFIINTSAQESKLQAFQQILQIENCNPSQILSIGNRLSDEIALAKKLGMKTCHVCTGEHSGEVPQNIFEKADWTINSLPELKKECNL